MSARNTDALRALLGGDSGEPNGTQPPGAADPLARILSESTLEERRRCAAEIAGLLDGGLCEVQIRDLLLYEVGCAYPFERDGFDATSWLAHLRNRMLRSLDNAGAGGSPS